MVQMISQGLDLQHPINPRYFFRKKIEIHLLIWKLRGGLRMKFRW